MDATSKRQPQSADMHKFHGGGSFSREVGGNNGDLV